MSNAITRFHAIIHPINPDGEVLVVDQLQCGDCHCDEWLVFLRVAGGPAMIQCVECGAQYSVSPKEVSGETNNALADYRPGNSGLYGGGD